MSYKLTKFIDEIYKFAYTLQDKIIVDIRISFFLNIGQYYRIEIQFNKTGIEHNDQFIITYKNTSPTYNTTKSYSSHIANNTKQIKCILSELPNLSIPLTNLASFKGVNSFKDDVIGNVLTKYMIDNFNIFIYYNTENSTYERNPDDLSDSEDDYIPKDEITPLIAEVTELLKVHKQPNLEYKNISLSDITIWTPYNFHEADPNPINQIIKRFKVNMKQMADTLLAPPLPARGGKLAKKVIKSKKPTREKIHILGRNRNVTKEGRKSMVTYQGKCISVTDARIIEKQLNKKT